MHSWFSVSHAWLAVGLAGQLAFGSRFVWQWIASERARQVVIPRGFWILSLLGGATLLVYAWHRKDLVFVLGQAAGLLIYGRNLGLMSASQTR